jgi:chorismate-pyruvate lyase
MLHAKRFGITQKNIISSARSIQLADLTAQLNSRTTFLTEKHSSVTVSIIQHKILDERRTLYRKRNHWV